MSYTKARTLDILNALYSWINTLLTTKYGSNKYYLTKDYTFSLSSGVTLPCVSIKVDLELIEDELYGRDLNATTDVSTARYHFTIHIHAKKGTTDKKENEPVLLCTQYIEDMLNTKNEDKSALATHGINSIYSIQSRLSDPRMRGVRRTILIGNIDALRED